jgi:hypothetical protein
MGRQWKSEFGIRKAENGKLKQRKMTEVKGERLGGQETGK